MLLSLWGLAYRTCMREWMLVAFGGTRAAMPRGFVNQERGMYDQAAQGIFGGNSLLVHLASPIAIYVCPGPNKEEGIGAAKEGRVTHLLRTQAGKTIKQQVCTTVVHSVRDCLCRYCLLFLSFRKASTGRVSRRFSRRFLHEQGEAGTQPGSRALRDRRAASVKTWRRNCLLNRCSLQYV